MASIKQALSVVPNTTLQRVLRRLFASVLADQQRYKTGSTTWDPANLVDGAGESKDVTVTGAALGDFAVASLGVDLQGITISAAVKTTNTVTVRLQNESGGALDLASSTVRVLVIPAAAYTATNLTA